MNDILIGAIIIIVCISVFVLMSVLVVDSHNENKKMEDLNKEKLDNLPKPDIDITFTEIEDTAVFKHLSKCADLAVANDVLTAEQQFSLLQAMHDRTQELKNAIDNEEYEMATNIRDEIQKIKLELKKYEKNI